MKMKHLSWITGLFLSGALWAQEVRIIDPVQGAYLSGEYEIVLSAADPKAVARTEIYVDNTPVLQRDGWVSTYTHDFGELIERRELYAVIIDKDGERYLSETIYTRELKINVEAESRIILLTAVVKTRGNKPILGLQRDQFSVFENGEPLEIQTFYNEYLPLDLVFLVDTSSSLRKEDGIARVKHAASTFLQSLEQGDSVNLYEFKSTPQKLVDFTTDRKRLVNRISELRAIGETALYDALHMALDDLKGRRRGRKAVVLFTDGRDSVYETPREKARLLRSGITRAQNQEVALYTIGLGKQVHKEAMMRLSEETGGRFHHADKPHKLPEVFDNIVLDLKHQYILGVYPKTSRSGFNRIEIKVRKRGAQVFSRKGYTRE
ncbi:MAG: VWA domain-containing protein [Acidobacteriota bacterium]|nr:VWA domain-containing protein [Acidobacteriota bacterium]